MKRRDSANHYFRKRIPLDVLDRARGTTLSIPVGDKVVTKVVAPSAQDVKVSLGTSDPEEVKARNFAVEAYLEGVWKSLRDGPVSLSHKQTVALSGELYKMWVDAMGDNPGSPALWQKMRVLNESARRGEAGNAKLMIPSPSKTQASLEFRFGPFLDLILAKHALVVDEKSRNRLLVQTANAMDDVAAKLGKFAEGDYSEDDAGKRFPKWEESVTPTPPQTPSVSLKGLLEGWWKEAENAGRSKSTKASYTQAITALRRFLKHDDATKVTPNDIDAFVAHLQGTVNPRTGSTLSPKTIGDSYLAGTKAVLSWAVKKRLLPTNPAQGIAVMKAKKPKIRERYFRLEERKAILSAAKNHSPKGWEKPKTTNAKRWVPWLCAYTGARVGEMIQLRKRDVREQEGHWVIVVTPEAGTVKNKEMRFVPVHDHLVEEGFLDFVKGEGSGYLFLNAKEGDDITGKRNAAKNRLADMVKPIIGSEDIMPSHGWRHTFKTLARETEGCDPKVCNDIVGHSASTVGDGYGESTVKACALFMSKFPRVI
ncbi:tyrosine-type recombinase/integrase [Hwanghaeella sp.]|uniref:tyrosine-type recombinase/integrase n=1 Tax=Hwanghaeella sp. TaxID=2605943 RepID=UPI003CCBC52B